jgi:TolB-like protein
VLIGALAFAQQLPVVVVAPFDVISDAITAEQASVISDLFFVRLGNTRKVELVNRNIVDSILREHQFQTGDWSDDNKTAELAKALNANWIVQGNIRKSGNYLLIIIQFYDIKTFRFEGGTDIHLANLTEAYDIMDLLVNSLIETISSSGVRTALSSTPINRVYNVGDTGPAGGIVFYDKGFVADGWQYLEAAPAEIEFTAEWGAYTGSAFNYYQGRDIPGTNTAVGSGKHNTELIVQWLQQFGEDDRAAQVCVCMDLNGYKDWFLPSRDELNLMYQILHLRRLGGFGSGWYWSSSQHNNDYSWVQSFSDGVQYSYPRGKVGSVRIVRAF